MKKIDFQLIDFKLSVSKSELIRIPGAHELIAAAAPVLTPRVVFQLQRNCLLTLCTDRILMEVVFDRYRCARLVLECLCKFEEETMVRMVLAIISILAAKIPTENTGTLASNPRYMGRLIEITRAKMSGVHTDRTMRFALSALWNLTDESPQACHCFYNLFGIDMAISCLKVSHSPLIL